MIDQGVSSVSLKMILTNRSVKLNNKNNPYKILKHLFIV